LLELFYCGERFDVIFTAGNEESKPCLRPSQVSENLELAKTSLGL
jgi:hypothetical protein